ncbi:MAG: hypothetical protein JWO02_1411 [Solirubrobacterales bacterium]|nr:hypothetical protein [Solirubrobacterales bacterium]
MTDIADDRSWWTDVEHLRPGGKAPSATVGPRPGAVAERLGPVDDEPAVHRGRITGKPVPPVPVSEKPAVLRRSDAAAFADAMDLDGAFGAPVAVPRSREIILTRTRGAVDAGDDEDLTVAADAEKHPAVRGEGSSDRKTVRINGKGGVHAEVAERRALREIGSRRPRSAVDRVRHRPDRIAMWVVLLGVFLVLIAATSSSAGA